MERFSDAFLSEEERAIMADEGDTPSEALDEQPDNAEAGPDDEDEPGEDEDEGGGDEKPDGEGPAGEQEFEIDGIKFTAVVAADGTHNIPIPVLQQLREQNKTLRAAIAAAPAAEPAKPEPEPPAPKPDDRFAHLRTMTATERMEYGMESNENAEELEDFNLTRLEERQVEKAAKNRMAEAKAVISEFEAEHSEELADPRYYGAIERSFDKHFASGKSAKEAMALAKADVDEWRTGKSEKDPDPPKKPDGKPARRIHSLAGRGAANRGAGDESSPDLEGGNYEAAEAAYAKMSPEEQAKWRASL